MIVINTGVPKSGTTLIQQYQIDLINASAPLNGINEIMKYGYNINQFSEINNRSFFSDIDLDTFNLLKEIHDHYGGFVIKTHCLPNEYTDSLTAHNISKITCCYRDPRDIILSTIDHGIRTRQGKDKSGAYKDVYSVYDGIQRIKKWYRIYNEWNKKENTLMINYENLIENKLQTLIELTKFLNIDLSPEIINDIYHKHESIKESAWNFNIGKANRWKVEMKTEDIILCNKYLREEILSMGYEL